MASAVRILKLVDGETAAVRSFAESKGFILDEFTSQDALMASVAFYAVTIIIADERLIGDDLAAFFDKVTRINPSAAVILLEEHLPVSRVVDAMLIGFSDVLERPLEINLLRQAMVRARANADGELLIMRLSTRELDVLRLLAHGLPNKVVATQLGISHRTVEVYRARIMDKLSVRNFAELLSIVLKSRHVFKRAVDVAQNAEYALLVDTPQ